MDAQKYIDLFHAADLTDEEILNNLVVAVKLGPVVFPKDDTGGNPVLIANEDEASELSYYWDEIKEKLSGS